MKATNSELVAAGMMGNAKAHYDSIVALFSMSCEDLKKISVQVSGDAQRERPVVPYVATGPLSAGLLKDARTENLQERYTAL